MVGQLKAFRHSGDVPSLAQMNIVSGRTGEAGHDLVDRGRWLLTGPGRRVGVTSLD